MSASPPALRGVHRRLAFPPPPPRASLAVLRELKDADEDLAWALFFLSRRVRDVAEVPPSGGARWTHAADVRAAAANAPEIAADLLLVGAPELALTDGVRGRAAGACHRLAVWASEQGYGELAIQLAEAAVAMIPGSARHTYEAGRINRMFGRTGDAEAHYTRAITLARPGRHWWVYVRAHLGLAKLCQVKGELERAAAHCATAARRAHDRSGEKWLAALIEHDLIGLEILRGDLASAHRHAINAARWMPVHHERTPALVHDCGYLLIESNASAAAMALLDQLVLKRLPSVDKMLIWSTFSRAAAATGDVQKFRRAESEVEALASRFETTAAAAFVNLGRAAHVLGLLEDAERHAIRGAELAREHSVFPALQIADPLLGTIRRGESPPPVVFANPPAHVTRLINDLLSRLAAWRGVTWKRKRQAGQKRLGVV